MSQSLARVSLAVIAAGGISTGGYVLLTEHEGNRLKAYLDPVGIPTICAGVTRGVKLGDTKTEADCFALNNAEWKRHARELAPCVKVPVTAQQAEALVDLAYNVGVGAVCKSTLLKLANAGDCWAAGREFLRWTKAGGRVLKGLITRRTSNAEQWNSGCVAW